MQIPHTSPTRLKDKTFIQIRFKLVYQQSCKNSEYRLIVRAGSGEVYSISFRFIFPFFHLLYMQIKNVGTSPSITEIVLISHSANIYFSN